MPGGRKGLALEVALAAMLGLAPFIVRAIAAAIGSHRAPHLAIRVLYVLAFVTGPGYAIGATLADLVVGTFSTDTSLIDRVANGFGLLVNVAAFGGLWFMLRTGSRESLRWKLAVALLVVVGASV